ncbi:MAG: phosphate acyltransferase PlsX [Clostridia bacterium]|nr:phosphate acyltransferase PlsX [Clostridia bacterium]
MSRTKIVLDIMSGDNAPFALIDGAFRAASKGVDLILVGSRNTLDGITVPENIKDRISFKESFSVVEMEDKAQSVMTDKKDSSMTIAMSLLRDGEADALVSAGNTGALFTAATLMIRRINGLRRAALTALVPLDKPFIIVDAGANVEVLPENLVQFAQMGSFYAKSVLGIKNARVGLLNNGTESTKGTQMLRDTYQLLKDNADINFIGNVESRELPLGGCDVAVCDGFTGNITVKLIEGMGLFMKKKLKDLFVYSVNGKISALLIKKKINNLSKSVDPK